MRSLEINQRAPLTALLNVKIFVFFPNIQNISSKIFYFRKNVNY